jgi:uncharacterized membrane protein
MTRPIFGLLTAVLLVVFTALVYSGLPAPPSAESILFGEAGTPGLRRGAGAFLGPVLALGLWIVLWLFPRVDPWREPGEERSASYWIGGNLVILVMAALHLMVVGMALGWPLDVTFLAVGIPGIFFLAIGSYLSRVPANWLLGVRTPWTLRSEEVWRQTHRLAGWTFILGGFVLLGSAFLVAERRPWIALLGIAVAGGIPAAYSYLIWRRLER